MAAKSHLLFLGTYTRPSPGGGRLSEGIYALRLDSESGALSTPTLVARAANPTWLALSPDRRFLYTCSASREQAVGFRVDVAAAAGEHAAPLLLPLSSRVECSGEATAATTATTATTPPTSATPVKAPCHLAVDRTGRVLLAANYHLGLVEAMTLSCGNGDDEEGAPQEVQTTVHVGSGPNKERQEAAHVHSVTVSPDNRFVLVCDLGTDRIHSYALTLPHTASSAEEEEDGGTHHQQQHQQQQHRQQQQQHCRFLTPAKSQPYVQTAAGAGPRHLAFSVDGRFVYAVNELDNTVAVYAYDAARGALSAALQRISTLPDDDLRCDGASGEKQASAAAEVRVHPSGRALYVSNRGHDSIAVFSVDVATGLVRRVQVLQCGGRHPRNFALSPDGRWLVCGHHDSDELSVFHVPPEDCAALCPTSHTALVPMCVCVLFFE